MFFEKPTQVKLFTTCGSAISFDSYGAIAYKDEFINAITGEVQKIDDYLTMIFDIFAEYKDMYDSTGDVIWIESLPSKFIDTYESWENFSDSIIEID